MIRAQKFYKTLPSKITQAEQAWLASQPQPNKPQARFIEHPPDGSEAQRLLGGALQAKYEFVDDEDLPNGETR
mgnify:CR=1 FL=1|tara:strand:- start:2152 stop:2370 length:219 start_codon:yes stop_codon:yes gene_type:complete